MAITQTALGTKVLSGATASGTITGVSYTVGDLLLCFSTCRDANAGTEIDITPSGGTGLTWTPLYGRFGLATGFTQQIWQARATSTQSAQTITVTSSNPGTNHASTCILRKYSGVAQIDPNVSIPADALALSISFTTTDPDDLLIVLLGSGTATAPSTPAGWTLDASATNSSPIVNSRHFSKAVSSAGSQSTGNFSASGSWLLVGIALTADDKGTAAQTLGLITQSASGNVQSGASGTIAQTISSGSNKLTQSASGIEKFTGSAAMTLGRATQAGAGWDEAIGSASMTLGRATQNAAGVDIAARGPIAMTLGRATQVASGIEKFTGSAAMTLGRVTQVASGWAEEIGGAAETLLHPLSMSASGYMNAKGTITQTLDSTSKITSTHLASTTNLPRTLGALSWNAGDYIVVMAAIREGNFGIEIDVTPSGGHLLTWQRIGAETWDGFTQDCWYAVAPTTETGQSITITPTVTGISFSGVAVIRAYSGVGKLDPNISLPDGPNSPTTGLSFSTTNANDMLVVALETGTLISSPTTPAGWSLVDSASNRSFINVLRVYEKLAPDAGAQSFNPPFNSMMFAFALSPSEGLTMSATGNVGATANFSAMTLPALKMAGSGWVEEIGSIHMTLPLPVFQTAAGVFLPDGIEAGNIAMTLPSLTQQLTGYENASGSSDMFLNALVQSLSGRTGPSGSFGHHHRFSGPPHPMLSPREPGLARGELNLYRGPAIRRGIDARVPDSFEPKRK